MAREKIPQCGKSYTKSLNKGTLIQCWKKSQVLNEAGLHLSLREYSSAPYRSICQAKQKSPHFPIFCQPKVGLLHKQLVQKMHRKERKKVNNSEASFGYREYSPGYSSMACHNGIEAAKLRHL